MDTKWKGSKRLFLYAAAAGMAAAFLFMSLFTFFRERAEASYSDPLISREFADRLFSVNYVQYKYLRERADQTHYSYPQLYLSRYSENGASASDEALAAEILSELYPSLSSDLSAAAGMAADEEADDGLLRNVQRIASPDNGLISGYEIMAARGADAADVAAAAEQAIETAFYAGDESVGSAAAVTLRERYPVVFDWLKTHDVNARVILAVMMAVVLFNMASAMLIMVLDRTGMIGVLKAMGMRNGAVRRVFLYRAAMLFVRGAAWGNAVGLALVGLQAWLHPVRLDPEGYVLSVLPVRVEVWWVVALNVGAVAVTVAVMTLPSMIVARISPEQTLKYRQ